MRSKTFFSITVALICATAGRAQFTLNPVPTREIGQPHLQSDKPFDLPNLNPNLVEGRELFSPAGVALDNLVTPPRIYVADTANHRILAWKDAVGFKNGAAADKVIGQLDFFSTGPNSTGHSASAGFNYPTGLAVDQGDLYVADSGNNRILRFRKPFDTPPDQLTSDLCIGQEGFTTIGPNYPGGQSDKPTANGIRLNDGNGNPFNAAIAFDTQHNLWLTDAGNNRVLRYAAADIAKYKFATDISATLEIGQTGFDTKQASPTAAQAGQLLDLLAIPAALAFDEKGRLYIADSDGTSVHRVLVFVPPFTTITGMKATRVMGIQPTLAAGAPAPTDPQIFSIAMFNPTAIFFVPGPQGATQAMGVVDSGYARILIFDPYDKWPDAATAISPSAKAAFGHSIPITAIDHTDGKSLISNDGSALASAVTLATSYDSNGKPIGGAQAAVLLNNELYVADTNNNRVIVLPFQSGNCPPPAGAGNCFGAATRVLGQDRFNTNSINLIEGREFYFYNGSAADAAVVMDSSGDTPHLYVADPFNNRVLGFRDVRKLVPGSAADIVIGQPDLDTAVCNYHPPGDSNPNKPTKSNLCHPVGLAVDASGYLYVADSANGRVLRFPPPFSHGNYPPADLVLGKPDFVTSNVPDASARNMYAPYGLAFAGLNASVGLLVSDQQLNRVLYFPYTNGNTFTAADNGAAAVKVLGQPDLKSKAAGNSDTGMSAPHHLATDTSGLIYVTDSGNSRVLVFTSAADPNTPPGGARAFSFSAGASEGIFVNSITGEIWVTDFSGNIVRKYPRYDQLIFNPVASATVQAIRPIAVTQDSYGDLIVAEAYNRVTFYYPALTAYNAAIQAIVSQGFKPLAPNTFASIYPVTGARFGNDTALESDLPNPLPFPTTLADIQVTVNGTAAPLQYVSPGQINFIVPWNAPTTGNADVQVLRVSTGQLLAAFPIPMNIVSPAIFLGPSAGVGVRLAAVNNQDGTVNDATHPAKRGEYISIWATGQGMVSSPPADGDIPRNGLVSAVASLRVWIGSDFTDQIPLQGSEQRSIPGVDNNFISFSGLSPSYPGAWQINVRIPQATAAGAQPLLLLVDNLYADNDSRPSPQGTGYRIVFYVQ
jgi:uncharacterized protein (TIGR03437 family)